MNRQLKTNCPNCGGVLENGKCSYCNTKVQAANELYILYDGMSMSDIELTLNIKQDGIIFKLPLVGRIDNVNMYNESYSATNNAGNIVKTIVTNTHVDFTFSGRIE